MATSPANVEKYVFLQDDMVQNSTSDTLNITYEDDNSVTQGGTYLCKADDVYSSSTATVFFAPLIITEDPADVFSTVNSRFQLNCSAVGFPAPRLQWIRLMPGEILTDLSTFEEIDIRDPNLPDGAMVLFSTDVDNNSSFDSDSSLTFDEIEPTDFGSYVCVATLNTESFINSTFNLTEISFDISDISVLTGKTRFNTFVVSCIILYKRSINCCVSPGVLVSLLSWTKILGFFFPLNVG